MDPVLLRERHGAVELLTINRPAALNALSLDVVRALGAALDELDRDADVRCVVLTGAGRAFVAGADIAQMKDFSAVDAARFAAEGQAVLNHLASLRVPTIAAVNGFALGGGCELAMACDLVLAGENARFGQPEVNLGVIPGFGGTQRLVRRVGMSVALDLCLTGRMVKADEAVAIGLCSRKLEGDCVQAALAVAAEIAAKGPIALELCKRAIHENADGDLPTAQAAERSLFALCFATADQDEGMAAFLEKRPAAFTGR